MFTGEYTKGEIRRFHMGKNHRHMQTIQMGNVEAVQPSDVKLLARSGFLLMEMSLQKPEHDYHFVRWSRSYEIHL